jgi:hypothetical protein
MENIQNLSAKLPAQECTMQRQEGNISNVHHGCPSYTVQRQICFFEQPPTISFVSNVWHQIFSDVEQWHTAAADCPLFWSYLDFSGVDRAGEVAAGTHAYPSSPNRHKLASPCMLSNRNPLLVTL